MPNVSTSPEHDLSISSNASKRVHAQFEISTCHAHDAITLSSNASQHLHAQSVISTRQAHDLIDNASKLLHAQSVISTRHAHEFIVEIKFNASVV